MQTSALADDNIRAHLQQRFHVVVAVVENAFPDIAGAPGHAGQSCKAGLQVCRKAWVEIRLNIDGIQVPVSRTKDTN